MSLRGGGQGFGASGKQSIPSASQHGQHTTTAIDILLPKLKVLLLYEVIFGPGSGKKYKGFSKQRLVSLVRERKKAGYGLQELGIQSCVGFGGKQVKECEKSVKKVLWDGDEGEDSVHGCGHHHHYFDDDDELSPDEEYGAHYQIYGRHLWDLYDSDGMDDYLPYY